MEDHSYDVVMNFNSSNKGADQVPLQVPIGGGQSVLNEIGEGLQFADHQLEAAVLLRRFLVPCFSISHSPGPHSFSPVLSTSK